MQKLENTKTLNVKIKTETDQLLDKYAKKYDVKGRKSGLVRIILENFFSKAVD